MSKKNLLLTIAASAMALCAAASPAVARADQELLAVIDRWEKDNGREARVKLLTRIGMSNVPPRQDQLQIAFSDMLRTPFGPIEPDVARMVDRYSPLLDAFGGVWQVPPSARIPDEDVLLMMPDLSVIYDSAKLLCLRGTTFAANGQEIEAATDFATAWLMARALEELELCPDCQRVALAMRIMALRHLLHLMSISKLQGDWTGFLTALVVASPETPTNAIPTFRLVFRGEVDGLKRGNPGEGTVIGKHGDTLNTLLEELEKAEPQEVQGLIDQFTEASKNARRASSMLGGVIPNISEQYHLVLVGNAMESVFHVTAAALLAQSRGETITNAEQFREALGARAWAITDPFCGEPLRVQAAGAGAITVSSCGPDRAYGLDDLQPLSDVATPGAVGDIYVQRK